MDRLEGMSAFVKAVDLGSFAAAGGAMGLSAQMVGKHVSAIEERLGARLLNRTTRRQSLTDVGRLYYERCKDVLADAEAAEAVVQEFGASPRGRLRLTAPITFGTYSLRPLITRYMALYPQVDVELALVDRFVDVVGEGFEAAIRLGRLSDSTLMARALRPYRLMACASPAYLEARGTPQVPEDLAEHDCLGFAYWSRPPMTEWDFTGADGARKVQVRHKLLINDSRALFDAALDGLGIMLGAEVMVEGALASGELVRVLPDYEAPSRPLHVLFPGGGRVSPKVRAFIDMVVEEFGP